VRQPPLVSVLAAIAFLAGVGARDASAVPCGTSLDDPCVVSSGNASIAYDPIDNDINDDDLSGLENWTINGVAQLFQQVFAVRIGGDPTINVGNLTFLSANAVGDTISASFSTLGSLQFDLTMTLGGSGAQSSITQTLAITATSDDIFGIPISIFMYTDLDLDNSFADDTGSSTADTLTQSDGATVATVRTTSPTSAFQVDNNFPFLLDAIIDGTLGGSVLLNNATGPLFGDINHAFQWDFTLTDENQAFAIGTQSDTTVPEPATLGLLGLGLIGVGLLGRKRAA
jgi:hypothetical protein